MSRTPLSGRKKQPPHSVVSKSELLPPSFAASHHASEVTLGVATAMSPSVEELLNQHVVTP